MSPTSFGPVKQIEAGVLNTGYVEAGPAVMLLHGWPYDIHSFADVTPLLAAAGYRVIDGSVGHNLPQEAPQAFAQAVIDADHP